VRGHQRDPQAARRQHHHHLFGVGQLGEKFGVAGKGDAGFVDHAFVYWRGDHAGEVTVERLERVTRILHADLQQKFGIARPRILVCGLNPHAGEGGHLGHEEIDIIEPTLERP
jgi:hypothetical protein